MTGTIDIAASDRTLVDAELTHTVRRRLSIYAEIRGRGLINFVIVEVNIARCRYEAKQSNNNFIVEERPPNF